MNRLLLATAATVLMAGAAQAALPRFPQPYGDRIVFVADGNVWSVAKTGGTAERLTSAPGQDMFPRASPDGRWIAYTEASNAGTDIWVIPAAGGAARRLTFHPATEAGTGDRHGPDNMVVTWTPDSKAVVFLTKRDAWNSWIVNLYEVPVAGGEATPLPIDSAVGLATFGPDGHTIAYNRIFRNFRTWKRYNGGLAQQIFTYDLNRRKLTQITTWSGTNTSPMWWNHRIYYLADRDEHRRANIWVYDEDTKQTRQVTHFTDYDIDFPALGGDAIAFQQGGKLYVMDLPSEQVREVPVLVPDDNPRTRPHVAQVKDQIRDKDAAGDPDFALAPNGQRTLFSARGDIFSVPTKNGATRDLTGTPGVDEDHPAWSPDGKLVAYTTDVDGSQQVAIRPAEGGPERVLTHFKSGYFYAPLFSPDGKLLAVADGEHRLWLVPTSGGEPRMIAQDKLGEIHDAAFSPDGRWVAYSMSADAIRRDLYLAEIATGRTTRLGEGGSIDMNPAWSPDGKYLYFVSNRHENPVPSDTEFDFAILKSLGVYAIPLARSTVSPVAPRSDEADTGPASEAPSPPLTPTGKVPRAAPSPEAAQEAKGGMAPPQDLGPLPPIHIDVDGMMARAVALPIEPAEIAQMDARDSRIYYLTQPLSLIQGPLNGEKSALRFFDLKTRTDEVIAQDVDAYALSLDGRRVLIRHNADYAVLETRKDATKDTDKVDKLDLTRLRLIVDPKAEWAEMFENAWRLQRDLFFSPAMNGVDWQAVHDSYAKLLPQLGSREDLNYLIGQMLGEMSNSHTYVGGGDDGDATPKVQSALLGADFALDAASGRYRFARIYPGDNTREEYRSPLTQPGLDVKTGDYLLAVNGVELKAPTDPDALLQLADAKTTVDLTVAESPSGPPRHVVVQPIANELSLREAAQIAHNREVVDRLSGGRIGYVYMSDMEQLGLQQFVRQFYAQLNRQALIMDDRWNGGGFIAPFALERLRRVLVALNVNREREVGTEPQEVLNGPKVALLNHWSGSDGDVFPYLFRLYHLGPLVGTRSWGGVRGIRGNWRMMDGGYVTIPEHAMYGTDSQWIIENHGVDPDVEVENNPADLLAGHDAQLETAVAMLMKQIAGKPPGPPPPPALMPAYPPSGMVKPDLGPTP
ncbi:MAG: PD40 domain-containing protein [Caulobacteraceae bacterium]|nr:PD40 domain-containing protein [Caulobacteraceae bacterium]